MNVAVLGLGSAGARHARNLLELGHEVVGFDPAPAPTPVGVRRVDSLEGAIAAAEAVVVASPSSLHAPQAVAALDAGRHVLVEKPLAMTVAEAEQVVVTAERAKVVCGVAMNLRFHPGVLALRRLLDEGALGTILLVQASFGYDLRLWRPDSDYRRGYSARADLGGGIVFDAIHELDYLLWLLGPIATVSAELAHLSDLEIDVEDVAVAIFRFDSGVIGTADLNFFEPAYRRGCVLVGAQAVARWDWRQEVVTLSGPGQSDRVVDVGGDLAKTYSAELADFLDAVESSREPRASAAEGLEAVRVADAIMRSSALAEKVSVR
jgi:predicted dehydrogenase